MWGNAEFDLPPIPRESMIVGMALHDRGYGLLDNDAIGEMAEQTWHAIARRGFSMYCSDAIADTIAKYHVRRLARNPDRPERVTLAAEFSQGIEEQLAHYGLSKELFERINRITDLLDQLSFNFCFEAPASGAVSIAARNAEEREVLVEYHVEEGVIQVSPWPFSADEYRGYIFGYPLQGYPERPDPFVLSYYLKRAIKPSH